VSERPPDEIQREIEQARVTLANAVDQIAYRTAPKNVAEQIKQNLKERARTPKGRAVIGAAGVVLVLLIVRRVRQR
jgi:hypothetical protein